MPLLSSHAPLTRKTLICVAVGALTLTSAPIAHAEAEQPPPITPSCTEVTQDWWTSPGPIDIQSGEDLYCIGHGSVTIYVDVLDENGDVVLDENGETVTTPITHNTLEADYVLAGNEGVVDLGALGAAWRPIGSSADPFTGTLDGNANEITGLSIDLRELPEDPDDGTANVGLFGKTSDGAAITDLTLINPSVKGMDLVGSLVGEAQGTSITNVTVLSAIISADGNGPDNNGETKVGGLVGRAFDTSISDVSVTGSVSGSVSTAPSAFEVGGIVGRLDASVGTSTATATLTNATFNGDVTGVAALGGIVGAADAEVSNGVKWIRVSNVRSFGSVSTVPGSTGDSIGGAIGVIFDSELSEVHSSSTVTAGISYDVGGAIGSIGDTRLTVASAEGDVTVTADGWCGVGGLIGSAYRFFRDLGVTRGTANEYPLLQDLSATGDVSCTGGDAIGGLVGYLGDATIQRASALGAVSGLTAGSRKAEYVGGIAGWVDDSVLEDVAATGNVTTEGRYVGGLIGKGFRSDRFRPNPGEDPDNEYDNWLGQSDAPRNTKVLRGSSRGSVQGGAFVGGLVGEGLDNDSTARGGVEIQQSFSTASVKGLQGVGGIVGGEVGDFVLEDVFSTGTVSGWVEEDDGAVAASDRGYVGGIAGHLSAQSSVTRSYTVSTVTTSTAPSEQTVGALIGTTTGTLDGESFSLAAVWPTIGTAPPGESAKAIARSAAQLKELTTYATWNAGSDLIVGGSVALGARTTEVWGLCSQVNSGYPFLQWRSSDECPTVPDEPGSQQDPGPQGGSGPGSGETGAPAGGSSAGTAPAGQAATPQDPQAGQPSAASTAGPRPTALPGLEVVAGLPADAVRVMRKPAGSTVASAPIVSAVAGQPVALAVRGLTPGATIQVRVRSNGKSASLGSVVVGPDGFVTLPAFRAKGAKRLTIALVDASSGRASFVKVDVQQARSKPKARSGASSRGR